MTLPAHLTPEIWLADFFNSKEALSGGVIKRQIRDVERLVGRAHFLDQARRRGYQVVESGRHFVVFCHQHDLKRVV
ncbi:N-(5'-phosphoribosyl)anthranilate isomerase [Nereida sp. MMG025]|uniref:N-(5'-phosphoribosyl)anthranilate isomerase n=1 Tax=Nereida sp. MMG025 TaxID=2909981 RepID=UPI001F36F012|nr:N-(5'-phosphoribosyl)anthranilate isomerase [Nereida sp. MMG025]MCF6445628.1 N-(5'-phosphoribosyl)anthranilate isomerase [Nereida sp. MMG025]